MISKILIIGGILAVVAGTFFTVRGIYNAFDGMKNSESAGIIAVTPGLDTSIASTVISIIGLVAIIIGFVPKFRKKRLNK
jgi:biopolymer transport protein ExbB/TolQ